MTSVSDQSSHVLNKERGGNRLNPELERFLSQLRPYMHGVDRTYFYYQTCKKCREHEAMLHVDPLLWHRDEALPGDFAPWYPDPQPAMVFAYVAQLPVITARLEYANGEPAVQIFNGAQWGQTSAFDFAMTHLWGAHAAHARLCGAPTHDRQHRVGTRSFQERAMSGGVGINDTFRLVNGCSHTDTDVLLVNADGNPLLLIEEYRPFPKDNGEVEKKYTTFSRSLSKRAGGGLVVLLRTDGHCDGPLLEEVWDTRHGCEQQLVHESDQMRGYGTLGNALLAHPVFAPYMVHRT